MLVLRHLEHIARRFASPVVTLGNFDGVHRGHQAILRRTVEAAAELGGEAVAITFWPHPAKVLAPQRETPLIVSLRQRIELLNEGGIDIIIVQRFSAQFATLTAEDFVQRLLGERIQPRRIVVGHRVSFGHRRGGNAEMLRHLGTQLGIAVEVIDAVRVGDQPASSSAIRQAIRIGDLDQAYRMLGRPHTVTGRVVSGQQRGRTIGFPTANLWARTAMLPPDGVYAVRLRWRGQWYDGIANIGFKPTFDGRDRTVEAHVFDFEADLYGERVAVAFIERLRGEERFAGVDALVAQIQCDVAAARTALARAAAAGGGR